MADQIIPQLKEYIATQILRQPHYVIGDDDRLLTSGLIDSFHLVDLSIYIEEQYGVRIDDTELNSDVFDTLRQLAVVIKSRQNR
ncbi:MAG TPA: acyl carrier protein [Anaerolineales bacterium]|nr:acyl carrier protein [Anaerolineales bacterium]